MKNEQEIDLTPSHLTETTQNYLKRIYMLSDQYGFARVSDIAKRMNRSLSSVTEAVQRMADEGLLNYKKYSKITLTELGKERAEGIHQIYSLMKQLLQILGVPKDISIDDACAMEHDISDHSIDRISSFIKFVQDDPNGIKLIELFNSINK